MQAIRDCLRVLFIVISVASLAAADSIKGCGGFVEASSSLARSRKSSDSKLDYSHIAVELQTFDGLVKERTQCAPNGYYFIPVYDKGSFVVKINGPEGWSWDPEKVPVIIDDSGCNGNEDINFRFTGFTLSGRVTGTVGGESCSVKDVGPSGVNVELLTPADEVVSSVQTSSDGSYEFMNIIPGKYKISASHPDLEVKLRGSNEIELGFANALVPDIFNVPGYDVKGSVVAQGNAILGVHVYLYSDDVMEVECPQGPGDAPGHRKALCHAVSDATGTFLFKTIPCGKYELMPYYKGENKVFDVSPPVMLVSVGQQHVSVPQKFQVTGFSIGGRVVDGDGIGVEGVTIFVDGHERSITDNQGYYKLDQVTANHYTIEATKEHYKFNKLEEYLVLPNMSSIVDIKSVVFDVCGVVRMVGSGQRAKITLTHGPANVKPQMKQTDADGNFCFEVVEGEYRLSALNAKPKSVPGLLFRPASVDVVVKKPVLNVQFSQALVNVHGSVSCKEKCGSTVSVTLAGLDGYNERKMAILKDESDEFHFSDVVPGKYKVEVKQASTQAGSEDNWCWEQNSFDIDVGAEDLKGIVFVQKGYWINVTSSHDIAANLVQPDGLAVELKIKKGSQRICLEHPGEHELQLTNSCISFGNQSVKIDASKLSPVHLKAEKYLVKGQINVESSSLGAEYELPESIDVIIQNDDGIVIRRTKAKLAFTKNDPSDIAVYEYSSWAQLGEKLVFVPQDLRDGVKKLLFYPRKQNGLVSSNGCQASIPPFSGRLGLYIQGSVSPTISGVDMKVIAAKDSYVASIKKGDLAVKSSTQADGSFVAGPLYDDITYEVAASKPGYHLKRTGAHTFTCQKLGQISVRVYSKDDPNTPISAVLLSLSGDEGYRNNSISGFGRSFVFGSLFPGNFYLRPLLKEYAFSPAALAIELGSGESREAVFEATRVAYSAMGTVTLLSGQPKGGVSIEARSQSKGYYEETVTDSNGNYRLRGLVPDSTYVIKAVDKIGFGRSRIERGTPASVVIKVGHEDIKGLDFLVFEQPEVTILSCHVEGNRTEELNSHLLVEIRSASDTSKIEDVFPLPLSNFFQVKSLPRGRHLVQLKPSRSLSAYKFNSEVIEVDLETKPQIHVGPLRYSITEDHQKQEVTPAPMFPLIIGVSVIALFITIPRLRYLYEATVGIPTPGFVTTVKKEPRKQVTRKKSY